MYVEGVVVSQIGSISLSSGLYDGDYTADSTIDVFTSVTKPPRSNFYSKALLVRIDNDDTCYLVGKRWTYEWTLHRIYHLLEDVDYKYIVQSVLIDSADDNREYRTYDTGFYRPSRSRKYIPL
jgi:hypothetical protein